MTYQRPAHAVTIGRDHGPPSLFFTGAFIVREALARCRLVTTLHYSLTTAMHKCWLAAALRDWLATALRLA